VVFAQVRISLINTAFTAIYLVVILPAFGVDLPLRKTLIVITFVAGLLPVVGNLISNTFIVIASLTYSGEMALLSLAYLVVIHKLEYFLNAKIIGSRIQARAWELLVAILAMEAVFGVAGVIAAPIYYCFIKDELPRGTCLVSPALPAARHVTRDEVDLEVDAVALRQRLEGRHRQRVGDEVDREARAFDLVHGEAHAVDRDRSLARDEAREFARRLDLETPASMLIGRHRSECSDARQSRRRGL
jgi:hypothetical protein